MCCKMPRQHSLHCPSNSFISCHPYPAILPPSRSSTPTTFLFSSTNLITKCPTSSTFPSLQILHIISSLLKPHYLPVSTPNSAVLPHSFANHLLLHLTIIQRPSHSFSIKLPIISNLGCLCASFFHLPLPLSTLNPSRLSSLSPSTNLGDLPH